MRGLRTIEAYTYKLGPRTFRSPIGNTGNRQRKLFGRLDDWMAHAFDLIGWHAACRAPTCLTLSTLAPETRIIAAEPEQADDAYRSFKAGRIIADDAPETVADGLKVPLKDLTWHFVSNHVTDILTASEQEIVDAMKITWKYLRVVMEPSSAVPLATVLKNKERFAGKRVGLVITGGNVDLDRLPWLAAA